VSPWPYVARHERTVRRVHDWQHLLGKLHAAWAPYLRTVDDPVGIRFCANFGAGEGEFELTRDTDGYVAIPTEGVTPRRLNMTEAEFARLDLVDVLRQVQGAAGCEGAIELVGPGLYFLGKREIAGKWVALIVAPRGIARVSERDRARLAARALRRAPTAATFEFSWSQI
jgi:hypothetical protein